MNEIKITIKHCKCYYIFFLLPVRKSFECFPGILFLIRWQFLNNSSHLIAQSPQVRASFVMVVWLLSSYFDSWCEVGGCHGWHCTQKLGLQNWPPEVNQDLCKDHCKPISLQSLVIFLSGANLLSVRIWLKFLKTQTNDTYKFKDL